MFFPFCYSLDDLMIDKGVTNMYYLTAAASILCFGIGALTTIIMVVAIPISIISKLMENKKHA